MFEFERLKKREHVGVFIGKKQSPWASLGVVALAALGVAATAVLGADQLCRNDVAQRLPLYPNATLRSAEHDFLRVRAAGRTEMSFTTPDDLEEVRDWNRKVTLSLLEREQMRGLADVSRRFEVDPVGGTLIFDTTRCGL